ncbi:MAG: hypothetical protein QOD40_2077 [Alphaproteobacteria bacterium]|nr:hypothetical protein [Alphaproteobacteria bacterium]
MSTMSMETRHTAGANTRQWWVYVLLGVVFLAMGIFVLGHLVAASIVSAIFFGAALAVSGAFQAVHAFWEREWSGFLLSLLIGLFYLAGGIFLLADPISASAGLTLVIAAMLIVSGVFRLILAYRLRPTHWTLVLSGASAILAGVLILAGWPASGLFVLGLFLGIDLLLFGIWWLFLGAALKSARL